jgi:MscS family membrane protein
MKEFLEQYNPISGSEAWIFHVFIVVFLVLLFNFVMRIVLRRAEKKLEATHNLWDDSFIIALQRPLRLAVWVIGLTFAADIVKNVTDATIFDAVEPIRDVGIIFSLSWFLVRFINNIEQNIIKQHPAVDRTTADVITRLLRISVIITSVLVALQTLGFSISGVLAFGGIGGVAVGFAAKDLLANFFGGLIIFLERPFSVGDWIRSPDRNIEGTVEKIGWRLTVIRTFDKRPLYVPNSIFNTIALENPSRMSHRRIYETIGIRYDDIKVMEKITAEVKQMLLDHPAIDSSQTMMVNFNAFAPSSCDFFVYTFTHTTVWTEFHEIKQDVLLKISDIITQNAAEIAYPTSTVHLPDMAAAPSPLDAMA